MRGKLRIEELFAFVAVDDDGTEGIPAFNAPGGVLMPMFGVDKARMESMMFLARDAARTGRKITLVRFSVREDLEEIKP